MAHLIGYVGEVSEDMLNQPQWELYNPGDIVGQSGVEQYYNDILMGKNGSRQVLVNSRGKEVGELSDKPAVPGKQLQADHRSRPADRRRRGAGRQDRRDRGHGSAHRRDAGHGEPSGLRSQRVRRSHHAQGMERA